MLDPSFKPIIFIAGAAGVGKTRLSNALLAYLQITHKVNTRFILEVLKAEASLHNAPYLNGSHLKAWAEPEEPIRILTHQAERIFNHVKACITRAKRDRTSLIVEGRHLVPAVYSRLASDINLYLVLEASSATTPSPTSRYPESQETVGLPTDSQAMQQMHDYYLHQAQQFGLETMVYESNRLCLPYIETLLCQRNPAAKISLQHPFRTQLPTVMDREVVA